MKVCCIACANFDLHAAGEMARVGYGRCQAQPSASSFLSASFERHCPLFSQAEQATVQRRRTWMEEQRRTFLMKVLK